MGYEVTYHYHERLEDGGYNKVETKELKRKVGDPFEEVSLEKLASLVMGQLARRDLWVTDVEIYELKKQKVNFRETKGGIVIKNKKFILDAENNNIVGEDIPEPGQPLAALAPHNNLPLHNQQQGLGKRPIKMVILDDTGVIQDVNGDRIPVPMAIKRVGLQIRANQRYPVFQEMDDPRDKRVDKFGHASLDRKKVYVMWDDNKREVTVSQDYFIPADIKLLADEQLGFTKAPAGGGKEPKLMFEQQDEGATMPELRGR